LEAAFSLDDKRLVTASMDGTVQVREVATRKTLFTLQHDDGVVGVAYSPNGQWIATSSLDQTARLWDASTGAQVRVFNGHNAEVKDIAFSPDGTRLATASVDKTAIIWDVANGQELIRLVGAQYALLSITYSPDGKYLATTDANGVMRLYLMQIEDLVALAQERVTRELTPEERAQFLQEGAGP
jgi:WD40 repeat protein